MEVQLFKYLAAAGDVSMIGFFLISLYLVKTLLNHDQRILFLEWHHAYPDRRVTAVPIKKGAD